MPARQLPRPAGQLPPPPPTPRPQPRGQPGWRREQGWGRGRGQEQERELLPATNPRPHQLDLLAPPCPDGQAAPTQSWAYTMPGPRPTSRSTHCPGSQVREERHPSPSLFQLQRQHLCGPHTWPGLWACLWCSPTHLLPPLALPLYSPTFLALPLFSPVALPLMTPDFPPLLPLSLSLSPSQAAGGWGLHRFGTSTAASPPGGSLCPQHPVACWRTWAAGSG